MTPQEVKRKLTAILNADVKGYSRLMSEDEKGTVRTLNAYKEVITNLIQQHRGRVVDAPGDNVLAEFGSVVDAVECAVEIQKELKTRNAELPENSRMRFRIGVNLGDVIEEGDRIFGDGVNIAAGLERTCDAGGICISGTAFDQVRNKLDLGYEYLGEHTLKNIVLPVRVYKVLMEPEAAGKVIGGKWGKTRQWQMATLGLVMGMIGVVAAIVIWKFYIPSAPQPEVPPKEKIAVSPTEKVPTVAPPSTEVAPKEKVPSPSPGKVSKITTPPPPKFELASKEKMAFSLPDKPSIAVLPFVNLSRDPKLEFFSDGMTEDIITALAKNSHLFVVARNSTFVYKGKEVKVKQVSEELGVRYILEGSIQRERERVRVTVQLIDALSGYHVWAERYDRPFKDILDLQDEVLIKITEALDVKMGVGDHARVMGKGTKNLEAYLKAREAREYVYRPTKEDNAIARKLAEEAITLDPGYARAYAVLAGTYMNDVLFGTTTSPTESLTRAKELQQKAVSLDESDGFLHANLAYVYGLMREFDKGFPEVERALALDPNSSETLLRAGAFLLFAGKLEDAISLLEKSIRLNPLAPATYYSFLSVAYRNAGRYEEAIAAAKQAVQRHPERIAFHIQLAAACIAAGRDTEARAAAAEVLRINPKFSLEQYAKTLTWLNQLQADRYIELLRKAGLE
jgi:adenylate cyclase